MEVKTSSSNQPTEQSKEIQLEDLFSCERVTAFPRSYELFFILPLLPFLLFIGLAISTFGFLLLWIFPSKSFRSALLKCIMKLCGILVTIDNKYRDENVKILVANHISVWDKLVLNFLTPCDMLNNQCGIEKLNIFTFWKDITFSYFMNLSNKDILHLKERVERSPFALLHFPEGAITNGKVGLLKFHPSIFSITNTIQPVSIQISKSSFISISPSVLGSSSWSNVFWSFVCPTTHYSLKILPTMSKLPDESFEDFSKRVQSTMASSMNLESTVFTSCDKLELEKRLKSSRNFASSQQNSQPVASLPSTNTPQKFGKSPKDRMISYQERRAAMYEAARKKYLEKHPV